MSNNNTDFSLRPKNQSWGIAKLCTCDPENQNPTHDGFWPKFRFWCKRCGLFLKFSDMDSYTQSEKYKQREAELKSKTEIRNEQ